jgi:hypothetical protein
VASQYFLMTQSHCGDARRDYRLIPICSQLLMTADKVEVSRSPTVDRPPLQW